MTTLNALNVRTDGVFSIGRHFSLHVALVSKLYKPTSVYLVTVQGLPDANHRLVHHWGAQQRVDIAERDALTHRSSTVAATRSEGQR